MGVLVLAAIFLGIVGIIAFRAMQNRKPAAPFVPDPDNKTSISVRGWPRAELDQILAAFLSDYELPLSTVAIAQKPGDILTITFPQDIEPRLLFFLVNYINYPENFDLTGRSIGVLAHTVVTPAFGPPDPRLNGQSAVIYVPADDTDYDWVNIQLEVGITFSVRFTNLKWTPAEDTNLPEAVAGL